MTHWLRDYSLDELVRCEFLLIQALVPITHHPTIALMTLLLMVSNSLRCTTLLMQCLAQKCSLVVFLPYRPLAQYIDDSGAPPS